MVILRSVGPVISTRRSSRSAGAGATVQSAARDVRRLGQEVEPPGARRPRRAAAVRERQQLVAAGAEPRCSSATKASASGVRISSAPSGSATPLLTVRVRAVVGEGVTKSDNLSGAGGLTAGSRAMTRGMWRFGWSPGAGTVASRTASATAGATAGSNTDGTM